MSETVAQKRIRPAYLPLEKAACWAGLSAEQLRRMVCRGLLPIYRPSGPRGTALVRLSELRAALEKTRWPELEDAGRAQEACAHA
jgi:hypothetical protein